MARRGQTTGRVHYAAAQRRVRFDQADLSRRCRQALAKIEGGVCSNQADLQNPLLSEFETFAIRSIT